MVSKAMAIVAALFAASGAATAAEDKDVARCAAIGNGIERLSCYDALAKTLGVAEPAVKAVSAGAWDVSVETSPVDDKKNVFLMLQSKEDLRNRFGTSQGKADLIARCKEGKTSLYIIWADIFVGSDRAHVEYRIDNAPVDSMGMNISTDHKATGLWSGGDAIPFIKKLFGKNQLLARVTPYGESPVMVTFPVGGLEQAIKPLREACRW